jgi:hypothetical protein
VLKDGTEGDVVKTFACDAFNHGFDIEGEFEFPFDGLNECSFGDGSTFVDAASESDKGVD